MTARVDQGMEDAAGSLMFHCIARARPMSDFLSVAPQQILGKWEASGSCLLVDCLFGKAVRIQGVCRMTTTIRAKFCGCACICRALLSQIKSRPIVQSIVVVGAAQHSTAQNGTWNSWRQAGVLGGIWIARHAPGLPPTTMRDFWHAVTPLHMPCVSATDTRYRFSLLASMGFFGFFYLFLCRGSRKLVWYEAFLSLAFFRVICPNSPTAWYLGIPPPAC